MKIHTAASNDNDPLNNIYILDHWSYRLDSPNQELHKDLLWYDLPLGMGINDPLPSENNPMFDDDQEIYIDPIDECFLLCQICHVHTTIIEKTQSDQGANISINPFREILHSYQRIKPFHIKHVSKGEPIEAIGVGLIKLLTKDNERVYSTMYHVPMATSTLLSPDFVCVNSDGEYSTFTIESNIDTGKGYMKFPGASKMFTLELIRENGLWYLKHLSEYHSISHPSAMNPTKHQEAELWSL